VRLLSSAPLKGKASLTNIRLGWKDLPCTNTVTYYENSLIADKKVL
jgi:hypothetical protein